VKLFPKTDLMIQTPKEKREAPTPSRLELPTTENGLVVSEMAMVSRNGQMVLYTMDTGKTTELMEKESSFTSMEISTMVTGLMIKLMDMVSITTSMVLCTKETGEMIFNMEKAKKAGLMDQSMKVFIWPVRNTEWDYIAGMMEASIMENGLRIRLKVLEPTVG
jgi:hypothetical protein